MLTLRIAKFQAGDKAMGSSGSGLSGLAGFGFPSFGTASKSKGADPSRGTPSGSGPKTSGSGAAISDDKAKAKAALNQTDPAALRGTGSSRVGTFASSRGEAAAMGQTMPLPGSMRQRTTSAPSEEQEHTVGEVTLMWVTTTTEDACMRRMWQRVLSFDGCMII